MEPVQPTPLATGVTRQKAEDGGGYWKWHDSVVSRIEGKFVRNVTVGELSEVVFERTMTTPKNFYKFKHTASLRDSNGKLYRVEVGDTQKHPYANEWAATVQARIGGLDRYHKYRLWTHFDKERNMYHILHAEATPLSLDVTLFRDILNQDDDYADPKVFNRAEKDRVEAICRHFEDRMDLEADASHPEILRAIAKIGTTGRYGENLTRRIPYFKMRYSPLMFRIWPQSAIMEMDWPSFQKLADSLETGGFEYATLGFPWIVGEAGAYLDTLHLHQLKTLQIMTNRFNQDSLILLEFFQRALEQAKKGGHTYSTFEELCTLYADAYVHPQSIEAAHNLNTIFGIPARNSYAIPHLVEALSKYQSVAIKHGIIRITGLKEADDQPTKRVIYALDDWKKEEYVVGRFKTLEANPRWLEITDGCRDEVDVRAKIEAALGQTRPFPPPKVQGAPHWSNPKFLAIWKRLDKDQQRGVINGILRPISFVGGRPGSGKTETMMALYHLLGERERVLPLAPYGRISAMLRKRLDGYGFTFHRVAAVVSYQKTSPEALRFLGASTFLADEYSLQTHHHWYMLLKACSTNLVQRVILFGDHEQMAPIGSGGFAVSVARHLQGDASRFVLLRLPHRFVPAGKLPRSADDFRWVKPASPEDPMAIAWNMKTLSDDVRPDLVVGYDLTNAKSTCVLTPRTSAGSPDMNPVQRMVNAVIQRFIPATLQGKGREAAAALAAADVQFVTQRNEDRKIINDAVFRYLYGDAGTDYPNALRIGERVTFARNAYFVKAEDGTRVQVRDRMMEQLQDGPVQQQQAQPSAVDIQVLGGLARHEQAQGPPQRAPKRSRTDANRGRDSDDVFNGELHVITDIVDVNEEGAVVAHFRHTSEKGVTRRGVARVIVFDGGEKQVNLTDDYDVDDISRAYCVTSSKMQGSEAKHAIYYVAISKYGDIISTLYKEELYMVLTRGRDSLTIVAGRTPDDGLQEIQQISRRRAPPHRNNFARRLFCAA